MASGVEYTSAEQKGEVPCDSDSLRGQIQRTSILVTRLDARLDDLHVRVASVTRDLNEPPSGVVKSVDNFSSPHTRMLGETNNLFEDLLDRLTAISGRLDV